MEDRHVAILLEEMRGQFKAFGEALQGTNDKISVMDEKIGAMDQKIGAMDERIGVMDDKIDRLAVDMVDVKARLTRVERALNGATRTKRKPKA